MKEATYTAASILPFLLSYLRGSVKKILRLNDAREVELVPKHLITQ